MDNVRCGQEHLQIWDFMAKIPDETGQYVKNILVYVRKKATNTWTGLKDTYFLPPTG